MPKKDYIDIEAYERKRKRKIRAWIRIFVYSLTVILIISNVWLWQQNIVKDMKIHDLTVMVTAERNNVDKK